MTYRKQTSNEDIMIAEGACVVGDVTLGKGVSVWYNAVLRGDNGSIVIGEKTNVQDNVVMHSATKVGENCTIGHGAIVHGCTIGDNVLVGMGAVVLNNAKIGNNCIIAAGSVVTGKMNAPDGSMVMGNPARIVRTLTEEDIESNRDSAREYMELAELYRKG